MSTGPEPLPLFEEPTLTVNELSDGIAAALRRRYPDEVWVRGEITNLKRTAWGHVYFDLCGDQVAIPVTLFDTDRRVVNRVLQKAGGAVKITDGTEVRIRARVQWFAKRGQVSLRMLSVDPAYTLGRLAEARELLLNRLRAEGAIGRNGALVVTAVPLRVGLVTSAGSAAAADFLHTLETSGFGWRVLAVDARVQGVDAERSVVAALRRCAGVDVVCLVRGGGARTDLAAFDSEVVARAIAATPVPVFTGIGHETDTTVADTVAHTAFKTPTACAAALVERVQDFAGRCDRGWERVRRAAGLALDRADRHLDRASGRAVGAARHHLRAHEHRITAAARALATRAPRALVHATVVVDGLEARVRAVDPAGALARGWTLTRRGDGTLVRSSRELADGELIVTTFADGTATSRIETTEAVDG